MVKAVSQFTITDLNDPIISGTAPSNPKPDQLWLNTSVTPNELLSWKNGVWQTVRGQPKPGSVGETEIQTGAVTSSKISDKAVTNTKISDNAITSTKITGGAITTPKLATNAVTTDKIAAGAITASKISAGTITADKLHVLAKSLVNNYSQTGQTSGWSPTPTLRSASEFGGSKFHLMKNDGDVMVRSSPFPVDAMNSYRVTLSMRSPSTVGIRYFGFYCYDEENTQLSVTPINVKTKKQDSPTKNPYFWYQAGSVPNWLHMVAYILGHQESVYSIPESKNVYFAYRLPANAHHCVIRYLNFNNETTESTCYVWSPTVTPVDAGEIEASRITTGKISSKNNESWLDLLNGRFAFGNNALMWDGSLLNIQGIFQSVIGDRTAIIRNGQFMILKNGVETFNITNFVADGNDVYLVLGRYARNLLFARSTAEGTLNRTYGGLQISPEKFYLDVPAEFKTLNVSQSLKAYSIAGIPIIEKKSNGLHVGEATNLYTYVVGKRYGSLSAANDNYLTLGRSDYRWMSLWVVSGVVQTSGKRDKEKIYPVRKRLKLGLKTKGAPTVMEERNPDVCFEEDVYELLDRIADGLCTFQYKNQEDQEGKQLGVIADEIDDLPAYPFVGTKILIPKQAAVEAKPEIPEILDAEGNVIQEYEPAVKAKEAVPEHYVHGLNPLPMTMLAISGYKRQREQIKELTARIEALEKKTKWML